MNTKRILGTILLVLGILALVYGSFSYAEDVHSTEIANVEFSITEEETVAVPPWLGAIAVGAGALLLFSGRKR